MAILAERNCSTLQVRVSARELAWYHEVARRRETTLSELIRALLVAEAAAAGVEVPAAPSQAA